MLLVPISCIYVIFIRGYLSDVFIPRISNASFELTPHHIANLIIGYLTGMIVFMYVIYQVGLFIDIDLALALTLGFTLFYIGRLITYDCGIFYGKLHFSTIFVASSIIFGINFFNNFKHIPIDIHQHIHCEYFIDSIVAYTTFYGDFFLFC